MVGRVGNENGDADTANPAGDAAFALHIDDVTGVVSSAQYLSLFHPDSPDNFNETIAINASAVTVLVTATDGDQDTISASHDVGQLIKFQDDGPAVDVVADFDSQELADLDLVLDESIGNDPGGPGGLPGPDDDVGPTAPTVSTDPASNQAIGMQTTQAGSLAPLFAFTVAPSFGADGPGTRSDILSLELNGTTANTTLVVTALAGTALANLDAGQRTVFLRVNDDGTVVEGVIPGTGTADDGDEYVAFRITSAEPGRPEHRQPGGGAVPADRSRVGSAQLAAGRGPWIS